MRQFNQLPSPCGNMKEDGAVVTNVYQNEIVV